MEKNNLVFLCAFLLFASLVSGVACAAPVSDVDKIEFFKASQRTDNGQESEVSENGLRSLLPYQHTRLLILAPRAPTDLKIIASPSTLKDWSVGSDMASPYGKGKSARFTLTSGQSAVITVTGKLNGKALYREFPVAAIKSDKTPPASRVSIATGESSFSEDDISLTLKVGDSETLYYELTNEDGSISDEDVTVFADEAFADEPIVDVGPPFENSVTITALRAGESNVTFMTTESGDTAVCRVTVVAKDASQVDPVGSSSGGGCDAGFGAGMICLVMGSLAMRAMKFSSRR